MTNNLGPAERALGSLHKEYMLIGKRHIRAWKVPELQVIPGKYVVSVTNAKSSSNGVGFAVVIVPVASPTILSIGPIGEIRPGDFLTVPVSGSHFGREPGVFRDYAR